MLILTCVRFTFGSFLPCHFLCYFYFISFSLALSYFIVFLYNFCFVFSSYPSSYLLSCLIYYFVLSLAFFCINFVQFLSYLCFVFAFLLPLFNFYLICFILTRQHINYYFIVFLVFALSFYLPAL